MTGQHLGEVDLKGARTTFGSSSGLSASVLAGLPAAAVPSHTPGQRRRVPGASDSPRSPQTRASAMDRAAELLFYVNGRKVSAPAGLGTGPWEPQRGLLPAPGLRALPPARRGALAAPACGLQAGLPERPHPRPRGRESLSVWGQHLPEVPFPSQSRTHRPLPASPHKQEEK